MSPGNAYPFLREVALKRENESKALLVTRCKVRTKGIKETTLLPGEERNLEAESSSVAGGDCESEKSTSMTLNVLSFHCLHANCQCVKKTQATSYHKG